MPEKPTEDFQKYTKWRSEMSNTNIEELAVLAQECHLYGQGIINEISPETIKKLEEMGLDIISFTREEIRQRSEEINNW